MIRGGLYLKIPALAGIFVFAMLLSGCATQQAERLMKAWPTNLPTHIQNKHVPFFPQEDFECGPASLAMVLQTAGIKILPEDLLQQVYLPGRQGSLQVEMLIASRRNGAIGYLLAPDLESILREVSAGNPVLVFQNLSLAIYPVWHYAVVTGFDRERNVVMMHSGRTPNLEMSLFTFERTWTRGGNWAMVALPPTRLPVTAIARPYAESVAAVERINPALAQIAYTAALEKWPDNLTLMFGAGNSAYALGKPQLAAEAYRRLLKSYPDFADAWNNLAQSLLDIGQHEAAADAINRAVALGGLRLLQYRELQRQINKQ